MSKQLFISFLMKINDIIRKLRSEEKSSKLFLLDMQNGLVVGELFILSQKLSTSFSPRSYVRLRVKFSYETCTDFHEMLIFSRDDLIEEILNCLRHT